MSKLARLIAAEEGYGIPETVPTRDNNPGDLRHSPHSFHPADAPDAIGAIDTPSDGWADLERQLQLYAQRGMTLRQAIYEFAPPEENNSEQYLAYVCKGLGVEPGLPQPDTTISVEEALRQL
jgi:hypothetical protein